MADVEFESVITDEMRALIGKEGAPSTSEVTTSGVRMWARCIGYTDRVFYDRETARQRGYRDLLAPPGYLGTRIYLPQEGGDDAVAPSEAGPRNLSPYSLILNGGTEVEYAGIDICAGDVLTSVTAIAGFAERYSAALNSPMLVQTSATTHRNQDGAVVAVTRGTVLSYGPKKN